MAKKRIVFVCLGNICRSPVAEAALRQLLASDGVEWLVDSAGTAAYHVGESPDRRTLASLRRHGIPEGAHKAWQFTAEHFDRFDHVIAMDRSNLDNLERLARTQADTDKLALFRSFDPEVSSRPDRDLQKGPTDHDTPDPYYGDEAGFDEVVTIAKRTVKALLARLST